MNDCADQCELADLCSARHWSIYWIIILCSLIFVSGRIMTLGINTSRGTTPFMSANDRSRWTTIRALGDENRYEIDDVIADNTGGIYWDTIDKVRHADKDGHHHFYSSKPTLLPTVLSWIYVAVKAGTGLNLQEHPAPVVRLMLLFVNAIPWAIYLWLLGKTMETVAVRDWTRYFIVATAGFATYLSTFAVTLNNHLPAAICVMAATYALVRIINDKRVSWSYFIVTGFAAAFAAANELPALSFAALAGLVCMFKSPAKFTLGFLPVASIVVAGFFSTNYLAHNDLRPPYAHRSDGNLIATINRNLSAELNEGRLPDEIKNAVADYSLLAPIVEPARWPWSGGDPVQRWVVTDMENRSFTIVADPGGDEFRVHDWNNWYDYVGSYWLTDSEKKSAIDMGQTDAVIYLFHVLFGHHGIFSLTPIWFFSLAGMLVLLFTNRFELRWLSMLTLLISVVVIGFYILVPEHDRNYGGRTDAFLRWAFWMAPLWLICMSPIVDWLGTSRSGRAFCLVLLFLSATSALSASINPWVHPWLYEIWDLTGLPK